jgi:hypothetical protein
VQLPAPIIAILPLLAACERAPVELGDCDDQACQQRWLEASIEKDPERVAASLAALPEGLERDTLIQLVMASWPEHCEPLCALLSQIGLQERCRAITHRPHLWQVDADDPEAGSLGAGQAYPVLAVQMSPPQLPWHALEPLAVQCEEGWAPGPCRIETAGSRARAQHYQDAWRICLGAEDEQRRYECFFQTSEKAYDPRGAGDPTIAAEMCLASGFYQDRCLGHLSQLIGAFAPAACWDDPDRWQELNHTVNRVEEQLARYDRELGVRWAALSWAFAMEQAYSPEVDPVGNPIELTHPAAMPHIAASTAWSLWRRHGARNQGLDRWATLFQEAITRRQVHPEAELRRANDDENRLSWSESLPGEESIQWVVYRGPIARRAIGRTPESDALICILEAAARLPTAHRHSLFLEALRHPDPLVRWTAARLMGERVPRALAGIDATQESDPLVRGRIEWGQARAEDR